MKKTFFYAAALLVSVSLSSCSKEETETGGEASLPTPTGNTKYLLKYRHYEGDSVLLLTKYTLSGNNLLLADTSYSPYYEMGFYKTRGFIYGSNGLSRVDNKSYRADGTIDTDERESYSTSYTYSGNTISEKHSFTSNKWNVYYMENGKIVRAEEVGDTDIDKYYYSGNDCIKIERFKGALLGATINNVFDDKKNPFYNNWFAFNYEALGEHNIKTSTRTYDDGTNEVDFNVSYLEYNSQDYPTKYEVTDYGTTVYSYEYIGW